MVVAVIRTLSSKRFETYLRATGHDQDRALQLYLWNAKLGAAFHVPIQAVEVGLRNAVNHALMAEFGPDGWKEPHFKRLVDRERARDLKTVKIRIARKNLTLDTNQVVAGLSFGFWVGMLQPRYNPTIWGTYLRVAFPFLPPGENRESLANLAAKIAYFRNRISHHEPLIRTDSMRMHGEILRLLSWICPDTAAWVRPHCDVPKLARQKP